MSTAQVNAYTVWADTRALMSRCADFIGADERFAEVASMLRDEADYMERTDATLVSPDPAVQVRYCLSSMASRCGEIRGRMVALGYFAPHISSGVTRGYALLITRYWELSDMVGNPADYMRAAAAQL